MRDNLNPLDYTRLGCDYDTLRFILRSAVADGLITPPQIVEYVERAEALEEKILQEMVIEDVQEDRPCCG